MDLWMQQNMFKNEPDAQAKARSIAEWLGDAHHHKTHGHPINFDEAKARGLKVERLEDDKQLQDKVLTVFHTTAVTFGVTNCVRMVESHIGKGLYFQYNQPTK